MSNTMSKEAQANITQAENKLNDAIQAIRTNKTPAEPNNTTTEPVVEAVVNESPDVDVVIDAPPPVKEPRRSEFVKTDDPKVIERINDLYGQVKKSDARNQMILEQNRQLEERLAEYAEKINQIERSNNDRETSKLESDIKEQLRLAREENDYNAIDQLEDKLLDIRLQKRIEKVAPVAQQKPQKPPISPQQQQYEQQIINNAAYIENLAFEKDTQGNLKRPYLYDWHPDNRKVIELFESIPKEFAAAGKQVDIKTIMEVLDERVVGKKSNNRPQVLGGDNNEAPARNVVRLTSEEIEVARKMGIKPEAYARQKQLLNR